MEEKHTACVLEAFDTLFNTRDDVAAERAWSRRPGRLDDVDGRHHGPPSAAAVGAPGERHHGAGGADEVPCGRTRAALRQHRRVRAYQDSSLGHRLSPETIRGLERRRSQTKSEAI